MPFLKCRLFILLLLFFSAQAMTAIDVYQFDTDSQRQRYQVLVDELRCPKCQNQNLAGSNSQIATDLRRELHRLLLEGKTDAEIKEFMVARYGDFVLYKPPLKSSTLLLWLLPLLMLVVGLIALSLIVRQRRKSASATQALSDSEQATLDSLVNENHEKKTDI